MQSSWTASAPLPGGEQMSSVAELSERLCQQFGWLPLSLAKRWASSYGSRTWRLLEGVNTLSDLGEHLGAGLYSREVDYLCREEWAQSSADILWRRSKLGLFMTPGQQTKLEHYLHTRNTAGADAA